MMTLSESLGQKWHPVSHAAPLQRNPPTPLLFLSLSPCQPGVREKKEGRSLEKIESGLIDDDVE